MSARLLPVVALAAALGSSILLAGSGGAAATTAGAGRLEGEAVRRQAEKAGIDIGAAIETVRHHVAPLGRQANVLSSQDRLYRAEFSPSGFSLTLRSKLSPAERAAKTRAWRASLPPEQKGAGAERSSRPRTLPAEAVPFAPRPASGSRRAPRRSAGARFPCAPAPGAGAATGPSARSSRA